MERQALEHLIAWQHHPYRMPLLLRGARQVGKSYLIESFAKQHFQDSLTVNFDLRPELSQCFTDPNPATINTYSTCYKPPRDS